MFNEDEMRELDGCSVEESIKDLIKKEKDMHEQLRDKIPEWQFDFEEYSECLAIARSRMFKLTKGDQEEGITMMVPFADMINHKMPNYNCFYYYEEKRDAFVLIALTDIPKNEELSVYYDKKASSNYEFFLERGFIDDNNPLGVVQLELEMDIKDPLYDLKAMIFTGKESSYCK